jgi:hypothetical protein
MKTRNVRTAFCLFEGSGFPPGLEAKGWKHVRYSPAVRDGSLPANHTITLPATLPKLHHPITLTQALPTPPLPSLTLILKKHLCPINQKNSRGGAVVSTPDLVS